MIFFLYLFIGLSVLALVLYALDKEKAKSDSCRIPESVLLGVGFFGGAVGALLGMYLFRHKTLHWYFLLCNLAGLAWQVIFIVLCFKNGLFIS